MEKFTPYEKLSKRRQRELNRHKRRQWGSQSPVTRKPQNPQAYNRQKSRQENYDSNCRGFYVPRVLIFDRR
jgi:hypothetical protein